MHMNSEGRQQTTHGSPPLSPTSGLPLFYQAQSATHPAYGPRYQAQNATNPTQGPYFQAHNATYSSQDPHFQAQNATYPSQSPHFQHQNVTYPSQHPHFQAHNTTYPPQGPHFQAPNTTYTSQAPHFQAQNATYPSQGPYFQAQNATYSSQAPHFQAQNATYPSQAPQFQGQNATYLSQGGLYQAQIVPYPIQVPQYQVQNAQERFSHLKAIGKGALVVSFLVYLVAVVCILVGIISGQWTVLRTVQEPMLIHQNTTLEFLKKGLPLTNVTFGLFRFCFTPCFTGDDKPPALPSSGYFSNASEFQLRCPNTEEACFKMSSENVEDFPQHLVVQVLAVTSTIALTASIVLLLTLGSGCGDLDSSSTCRSIFYMVIWCTGPIFGSSVQIYYVTAVFRYLDLENGNAEYLYGTDLYAAGVWLSYLATVIAFSYAVPRAARMFDK